MGQMVGNHTENGAASEHRCCSIFKTLRACVFLKFKQVYHCLFPAFIPIPLPASYHQYVFIPFVSHFIFSLYRIRLVPEVEKSVLLNNKTTKVYKMSRHHLKDREFILANRIPKQV